MLKSEKRSNPKGIKLMANHFSFISNASRWVKQVSPAAAGKINNSGTGYKAKRIEQLVKQRRNKKLRREKRRARQALKRAA